MDDQDAVENYTIQVIEVASLSDGKDDVAKHPVYVTTYTIFYA